MSVLLPLIGSTVLAYEVDSWTPHQTPLEDVAPLANAVMERMLDRAVQDVRCHPDDAVLRRRLARAIRKVTARRTVIGERPLPARLGHGRYSAWLESDPLVPRVHTGSGGIYDGVGLLDGPVLHLAGTASTVRMGDVLIGTDKTDHFLATGQLYLRWSRDGEDPERAARRGVRTERLQYGRLTSKAFSYADLAANWDGYRFYSGLLGPDSPIQRDGPCALRTRAFDWTDWVAPDWDELHNPSVYGPRVRRAVRDAVEPYRDAICARYAPLPSRIPVPGRAPEQPGPFGQDFCDPRSDGGGTVPREPQVAPDRTPHSSAARAPSRNRKVPNSR
jgi:hypothetical protein